MMMNKISAVYKITNTVTGDFYIGSSKDVKQRWASHKCLSVWKKCQNNPIYKDFQKYGLENFDFQILEEAEIECLKEKEQQFIEILKPTYNSNRANGWDTEKIKKSQKKYQETDKRKDYLKSDKYKKFHRKANSKYNKQLCIYNGEILTLVALSSRFIRAGVEHPNIEAKKYLMNNL